MADAIEITVREVVEGSGNISKVGGEIVKVDEQTKDLNKGQKNLGVTLKNTWTEGMSKVAAAKMVFRAIQTVADETIGTFVEYAEQVRNISLVTGESTEEVSRLLQVTDDYKIDAQNLTTVMKKMATEGFAFTTDALADLSDEYLKLEPGVERQLFLTEKFGREGAAFAEIMLAGGDAIREQSAAVSDSLILTQKAIDEAREYEKATDNLNDAVEGLKIQIGRGLVPPLTDLINATAAATGDFDWFSKLLDGDFKGATEAAALALENVGFSADETDKGIAKLATSTDLAVTSTNMFGSALNDNLDPLQQTQAEFGFIIGFAKSYETGLQNIQTADANLQAAQAELFALTQQGFSESSTEVINARDKVAELEGKLGDAQQASLDATNEMIAGFLQAQLTADGSFTEEDIQKVLDYRLSVGLLTQEAYNAALNSLAVANNLASIPPEINSNINIYERYFGQQGERRATGGQIESGSMMYSGAFAAGGSPGAGNYIWDESAQSRPEVFVGGGGYVLTKQEAMSALGGMGGSGVVVNLTYAPVFSMADEMELSKRLLPFIKRGIREAR